MFFIKLLKGCLKNPILEAIFLLPKMAVFPPICCGRRLYIGTSVDHPVNLWGLDTNPSYLQLVDHWKNGPQNLIGAMKKKPGCLGCIGDFFLPDYMGIFISQYKDPFEPTRIQWKKEVFFCSSFRTVFWAHLLLVVAVFKSFWKLHPELLGEDDPSWSWLIFFKGFETTN